MTPPAGRQARAGVVDVGAVVASLLAGLAWRYGHLGPWLSPALAFLVPLASGRGMRFAVAAAYFAGGEIGGPLAVSGFFGPGHLALGLVLWTATIAALAAPWIFARTWPTVLLAVVIDALPPLGLIGWLSPLSSAGALFPGTGWLGVGFAGVLLGALAAARRRPRAAVVVVAWLAAVAAALNAAGGPQRPPAGWVGVDTAVGPVPNDALQAVVRNQTWIRQAATAQGAVVVLPEAIAGYWGAGTLAQLEASGAIARGERLLVGATLRAGQKRWNGLVLVDGEHARLAFRQVFPIPLTMWRPWTADSYTPAWWERVGTVAGERTWASICYDQVLVWPWLEALAQRPSVVVAVSNGWWAAGTGIPAIQGASVWSWARLLGARVVVARNR